MKNRQAEGDAPNGDRAALVWTRLATAFLHIPQSEPARWKRAIQIAGALANKGIWTPDGKVRQA